MTGDIDVDSLFDDDLAIDQPTSKPGPTTSATSDARADEALEKLRTDEGGDDADEQKDITDDLDLDDLFGVGQSEDRAGDGGAEESVTTGVGESGDSKAVGDEDIDVNADIAGDIPPVDDLLVSLNGLYAALARVEEQITHVQLWAETRGKSQ